VSKLLKTLNKFNGNLFVAAATDRGDIVIECDYHDRLLSYAYSTKLIKGICNNDDNSYLVVFGDGYIGKYQTGMLVEDCLNTGISNIHKITRGSDFAYYLLNRTSNQLVKVAGLGLCNVLETSSSSSGFSSSSSESINTEWTFDLPDYGLRHNGDILYRASDNTIIYYNNANIYLIRDDGDRGIILNSLSIGNSGEIKALISSEFNVTYADIRARMIDGEDLAQSSSSSSSSTSSSSQSTSSSSSTSLSSASSMSSRSSLSSISSESSTSSYIENWSSSSTSLSSDSSWTSSSQSSSSGCYVCADLLGKDYCFTASGFTGDMAFANGSYTLHMGTPYYPGQCVAIKYMDVDGEPPWIATYYTNFINWEIAINYGGLCYVIYTGGTDPCDPTGTYTFDRLEDSTCPLGSFSYPLTVTISNGACP
jgi:hypothetical protein